MDADWEAYTREHSIFGMIPSAHTDYLFKLKQRGVNPQVIYDVGSNLLHWTNRAEVVWPTAKILCFDGTEELGFLYQERHLEFFPAILSNEEREVDWYENLMSTGGSSYYRENGDAYKSILPSRRKTTTLDLLVKKHGLPYPELMKLDVQGCEMDVLSGAADCLKDCQHLIVEMQKVQYNRGAPLVNQTKPFIESLGFVCKGGLFCDNGPDGDYYFERV